jgi:hypothetical protein
MDRLHEQAIKSRRRHWRQSTTRQPKPRSSSLAGLAGPRAGQRAGAASAPCWHNTSASGRAWAGPRRFFGFEQASAQAGHGRGSAPDSLASRRAWERYVPCTDDLKQAPTCPPRAQSARAGRAVSARLRLNRCARHKRPSSPSLRREKGFCRAEAASSGSPRRSDRHRKAPEPECRHARGLCAIALRVCTRERLRCARASLSAPSRVG